MKQRPTSEEVIETDCMFGDIYLSNMPIDEALKALGANALFKRAGIEDMLKSFGREEALKGIGILELFARLGLKGLSVEERLEGLSAEEIEAHLRKLKKKKMRAARVLARTAVAAVCAKTLCHIPKPQKAGSVSGVRTIHV